MKQLLYLSAWILILVPLAARTQTKGGTYRFEKKISLSGTGGWDYLAVDSVHGHLFVSHGNEVDIIDLKTERVLGRIDSLHGVHGIAIDEALNRGFISNGQDGEVTVFDLFNFKKTAKVAVTGKDPDCIVYDDFSRQVFTFNGGGGKSTVIDARTLRVKGTISLGGKPEFAVSDGKGKIYNNLEDKNEIVVIDTKRNSVVKRYALSPCGGPSALAMDLGHGRLFTACRQNKGLSVLNSASGRVIQTLPIGAGVDAAAFDPGTALVFASCGDGTVAVIHEDSPDDYRVIQMLATPQGARTMALDRHTHRIYLSDGKRDPAKRRRVLPGSFGVLVYGMR
jgi:DNA-binding beta-propeller fold protein YncE